MDFISTHAPPVPITVNGTAYSVPRFLFAAFKEWAAKHQATKQDEALKQLESDEMRARFLMYHQPPPLDIVWIGQQFTSPDGAEYIVREQLAKANVPAEEIDGLIENVDPVLIRNLADELRSGNGMIAGQMKRSGDPGTAGNPTTGLAPTSGGSPTITDKTGPTSSEPTQAENQAA